MPAELVQLVFQHLDLRQIFQCRRVSPKWSQVLCDGSLIRTVLEPWRSRGDFRLDIPRGTTSKQALDLIAEHQEAFRTGNAFSTMTMRINCEVTIKDRVAYSEGYLAWWVVDKSDTGIAVHDIISGKRLRREMPVEEGIHCMAISSTLLAAVSYKERCYVWAHSYDGKPCSVRLPRIHRASVRVFSNTVVLHVHTFLASETQSYEDSIIVIQCAMATQRMTSPCQSSNELLIAQTSEFSVNIPERDSTPQFAIDSTGKNVIVVCRLESIKGAGLVLSDYNLEGNLEFEGSIPGLRNGTLDDSTLNIIESSSAKSERLFNIWFLSRVTNKTTGKNWEAMEYTHAVYSPSRRRIEIKSQSLLNHEIKGKYEEPALLWKGILYTSVPSANTKSETAIRIVDLEKEVEGYPDFDILPITNPGLAWAYQLWGDEIFTVQLGDQTVSIWCFDRNVQMFGEDSESRTCQSTAVRVKMEPIRELSGDDDDYNWSASAAHS